MKDLLKVRALSFLRYGKGLSVGTTLMEIATLLVFGAFAYGAYNGIQITLRFLVEGVHLPISFLHSLMATGLFALFVMTGIGNSVTAFSAFFRSEELDYLFTLPLNSKKLFLFKFAENFFRSSTPMFLLGGSALLAYGIYFRLSIADFLLIIAGIALPFIFIAAALGTFILFLIVRISTIFPTKFVITAALLITLGGSGTYFQSVHPVDQVQEIIKYYPDYDNHPVIARGEVGNIAFVPSTWAARALFRIVDGDIKGALPHIALMIGTCFGIIFLLYSVSGGRYYQTWLNTRGSEWIVKRQKRSLAVAYLLKLKLPFSKRVDALLKRDMLLFIREPSQWGHLIIFGILLLIYVANMSGLTLYIADPFRMTLLYIANFIFGGFFLVSLAVRFVFPLMSQEGRAFWIIRSSPNSMKFILRYKSVMSFIILLLIGLPLLDATSSSLNPGDVLYRSTMIFTLVGTIVIALISLGAGAWFADLKEKSPIRAASSRGATVAFLLTMFYLIGGGAILSAVALNTYKQLIDEIPYESVNMMILAGIFGVISVLIAAIGIYIGNKALSREDIYAK